MVTIASMQDYLIVLAFASLPAIGNFAGGLLAESFRLSKRLLSLALHGAAGIILAVVGVELMPQILQAQPPWVIILAFVAGGCFFVLMDQATHLVQHRLGKGKGNSAAWAIFFGVATDLFSDGLMIGAGSTITFNLAFLLALGQVTADIPEGFATIAMFKRQRVPRRIRQWLSAAFFIPIFLGATIGYWAVRGQSELLKLGLLAFTAGILTTVAVEEMLPEAHENIEDTSWETLVFVSGFALFALLSVYLG
jgi:ZIP family zinc transporter